MKLESLPSSLIELGKKRLAENEAEVRERSKATPDHHQLEAAPKDWTQFNHQVFRVKLVWDSTTSFAKERVQIFRPLTGQGVSSINQFEILGKEINPRLRVGDKGDLKIVSSEKVSRFIFIPDRKKAQTFLERRPSRK